MVYTGYLHSIREAVKSRHTMPNPSLHRDVFRALSGKEQELDDVFPRERVHHHPWKVYRLRRYGVRQSDEDMRGLGAQGRLRVWRGSEGELRAGK